MKDNSSDINLDSIIEGPTDEFSPIAEYEDVEELTELALDPTEGDSLCESAIDSAPSDSMYGGIIQEVTEELAYLKASRIANYKGGGNFSNISEKRLRGLKTLSELISLRDKELAASAGAEVDFNGEGFKNITQLMLKIVKKALEDSNVDSQTIQTFFSKMQKELIGYEGRAKRVYRGENVDNVLSDGVR